MKTNMINTNSVIKTICAVVMLLGMSVSAWGTTPAIDETLYSVDVDELDFGTVNATLYDYGLIETELSITVTLKSGFSKGSLSMGISDDDDEVFMFDNYSTSKFIVSRNNASTTNDYEEDIKLYLPDHNGNYSGILHIYIQGSGLDEDIEIPLSATVTGACTAHTISLTNSGTGTNGNFSSDKSSACSSETITLTASPSSGYELDEWTVSKAGGGTCTVNGSNQFTMPDVNVTVSATFKAATYSLSFNKDGGKGTMSSVDRVYNSTAAIPTCTFTRAGYVCDGWATSSGGDKVYNQGANYTMGAGDATLYAHWVLAPQALKAWCETTFGIYDQAGTGDADIHLTSTYNVSVYTTYERENLITIIAENLDAIANLGGGTPNKQNIQIRYLDANNGDAEVDKTKSPFRLCYYNEEGQTNYNVADGSNINLNGLVDYSQTYAISYTPKDYNVTDHYKLQLKLQNNTTEAKTITLDLYGRSLPREFVIAAKYVDPSDDTNNGKWFALPNTIISNSSLITPIEITVDNATEPTKAIGSPSTVLYRAMNRYTPGTNRYAISFTDNDVPAYASRNKLKISKNSNYVYLGTGGSTTYQDWYLESSDFGAYTVTMPSDDSDPSGKSMGLWSYGGVKMGYYSNPPKGADIFFLPVDYGNVEADIMEWGTDHLVMELRDPGTANYVKTQIAVGDLGSKQTLSSIKKDEGVYYLSQTLSTSNAGQDLKIYFYNSSDVLLGVEAFTIPMLISASNATTSDISAATAGLCDLVVLNGGVLTVSETTSGAKKTFRDLYIYGGGKMVVPTSTYVDFSNVYMRGGHLNASWQYQYSNPQLVLNGTMGNASDTINYDYLTNNAQFYSLALPYPVKLKDIVNPYFNNKQSWEIHAYNGRERSTGGTGWYDVETGTDDGIDPLETNDALSVGVGYTFWGAMQKVNGTRQLWSVNRFKMPLASGTAEAEKFGVDDGVDVTAYGMTYDEDLGEYVYDENVRKNNAGWNMVGNPFLADIVGSEELETSMEAIIIDHHEEKVLDPESGKWTGQMKWVENETGARYVRIPFDNGENYHQVRFKDTTLRAFHHFFIQVGVNGKFRLEKKYRAQSIVARMRANGAVLPAEMDIDFILRNGNDKTSFGLTVNDAFVTGFQAGEDMPDELGGVNMKGYTLANGERLSYNGLPSVAAEQLIPVGYRAQTAGTHTISYKHGRYDDYIEHIWLTDYVLGQTVDLLNGAYEFTTGAGVFDDRFALNVVFNRNQMPTGIDEVESFETDEAPVKFIYNDKMFIRYKGIIYDATGKKVGEVIRNK